MTVQIDPIFVAENFLEIRNFFYSEQAQHAQSVDQYLKTNLKNNQQIPGYCSTCQNTSVFVYNNTIKYGPSLKETFRCIQCRLSNRQRTLMSPVTVYLDNTIAKTVWIAEHDTPLARYLQNRYQERHTIITSCYDAVPDARQENIEDLSFDNESIDLIITAHVMQTINNPVAAWKECYRVLRPGGQNIFTVPISTYVDDPYQVSIQRCKDLPYNQVEHYVLPPDYYDGQHLCYTGFGFDLLDLNKSLSYIRIKIEYYWSHVSCIYGLDLGNCVFRFVK